MMPGINRIEQAYRELTAAGKKIIKLYSGNPNEAGFRFPPEVLEEVYRRYFRSQEYRPHPKGLLAARRSIADYYAGQGASVDPENLILTSGTSESFFYLFSLLTKPGDNILTPNPAYPLFDHIAELARIELRQYHLIEERDWGIDVDDLKEKTNDHTKAIVLVSPNNPTGAVASVDQIREIIEWTNRREIPLICDEVFCEFYFGTGKFPRPIATTQPNLCFTLNGISKMFALPAMKLGWIAVTGEKSFVDPAVDRLETIADTFLSCHIPIQEALPVLFREGRDFLEAYRREVEKRRGLAIDLLKRCPKSHFVQPVGGFYLMASLDSDLTEEDFVIRLMKEKNVFVHPGYFFDYEKGTHIVISFLSKEETLRGGLEAVLDFISLELQRGGR